MVALLLMSSFPDELPGRRVYVDANEEKGKECPKHRATFPSRLIFWWLNSIMIKGWRRPLTFDDLWKIRDEDKSENLFAYFNKFWKKIDRLSPDKNEPVVSVLGKNSIEYKPVPESDRSDNKQIKKEKIFVTLTKSFWFYFLPPNILKLIADVISLMNPMVLK